jgi:hypothetical protein
VERGANKEAKDNVRCAAPSPAATAALRCVRAPPRPLRRARCVRRCCLRRS